MYFRKNNGVTLLALTITIIVMLIISSTIIYNINSHVNIEKINKLYNDIENLNTKIEDYYLKYGDIPVLGKVYCTTTDLINILNKNKRSFTLDTTDNLKTNPNDGNEYYIIDLEKLDGLILNYGYEGYQVAKTMLPDSITNDLEDLYIINKKSHQIYYPSGIFTNDSMYYQYKSDDKAVLNKVLSSNNNSVSLNYTDNILSNRTLKVFGNSEQDTETYGDPAPDNPVKIKSVGDLVNDESDINYNKYKLPITISRKNLFDLNKLTINAQYNELQTNGVKVYNWYAYQNTNYKFTAEKDMTLTFSYKCVDDTDDYYGYTWLTIDGKTIYNVKSGHILNLVKGNKVTISFAIHKRQSNYTKTGEEYITFKDIQLEYGEVATPYEPYVEPTTTYIYLNEPLRKIENAVDYIDLVNKKVVRNVKVLDDTGTLPIEESLESLTYPNTELIDIPDLNLQRGLNIITINTEPKPSKMELIYYNINNE